jgi:alpha-D-ribose 1-methylphosphonate 5-phosphate C-P lyase
MGAALARHDMCESALKEKQPIIFVSNCPEPVSDVSECSGEIGIKFCLFQDCVLKALTDNAFCIG